MMETIIRIKKDKPAFKALILLAKELEKNDHTSITISEVNSKRHRIELILTTAEISDPSLLLDQLSDFPSLNEIRNQAWSKR